MGQPPNGARVEDVFSLTGRGLVLVLRDGFEGVLPRDGTVRGARGASAYRGPDIAHRRRPEYKQWVCVTATAADAADLFRPGDAVTFHPPDAELR